MLANMAPWAAIFGGGRSDDEEGGGSNMVGLILMAVLAPLAAMLIQMAISRSRKYLADEGVARISGKPYGLAPGGRPGKALLGFPGHADGGQARRGAPVHRESLTGQAFMNLFSTHPPIEERVARLRAMRSY